MTKSLLWRNFESIGKPIFFAFDAIKYLMNILTLQGLGRNDEQWLQTSTICVPVGSIYFEWFLCLFGRWNKWNTNQFALQRRVSTQWTQNVFKTFQKRLLKNSLDFSETSSVSSWNAERRDYFLFPDETPKDFFLKRIFSRRGRSRSFLNLF